MKFRNWTAAEKRRLGIGNLYAKYFPGESCDAHRAIGDVDAMIKLFTWTPLASILSSITVRNVQHMSNEHART